LRAGGIITVLQTNPSMKTLTDARVAVEWDGDGELSLHQRFPMCRHHHVMSAELKAV
jgi:hypothetical protein